MYNNIIIKCFSAHFNFDRRYYGAIT